MGLSHGNPWANQQSATRVILPPDGSQSGAVKATRSNKMQSCCSLVPSCMQARVDLEGDVEPQGAATDGISMEWDLENVDENYDPSARFPYGC